MAPHSSTPAWKIPWTEEPGRLQSMGSLRVGHFTFTFHCHALEKEMATHSSVLAWRIPGTGEPGGLPSMGSHRVGHNWSDLATAKESKRLSHKGPLGLKNSFHSLDNWPEWLHSLSCWITLHYVHGNTHNLWRSCTLKRHYTMIRS